MRVVNVNMDEGVQNCNPQSRLAFKEKKCFIPFRPGSFYQLVYSSRTTSLCTLPDL